MVTRRRLGKAKDKKLKLKETIKDIEPRAAASRVAWGAGRRLCTVDW
jgi:hypothetical protein